MRVEEIPKPLPKPHEALVRIESVGVCGSDMHYFVDGCIGAQMLKEPTILGHEYAGMVEAVGGAADATLVGKRVAVEPGIPCFECESCRTGHYNVCRRMFFPGGPGCDGALCEYMTVHAGFCFPVPDNISAAEAAMIEPAAVGVHTIELAQLKPGDIVAIFGLGSVGLLAAQVAKFSGARVVYGVDVLGYRAALAHHFGVDAAFHSANADPVAWLMEQTGGRGVDVGIDCTNGSEGLGLAVKATRPAGRCVLTGISGREDDLLPVSTARRRELTLQWCRRFKDNFPATIALVAEGKLDVRSLLTHSFPLDRAQEAFDLVARTADNVIKASIDL
jgi:L-iditol 2-dehydrogenase